MIDENDINNENKPIENISQMEHGDDDDEDVPDEGETTIEQESNRT